MTENEEMTAEERAELEAEQARLEAEERARIEHENMLNSFPESTVFFNEIIVSDDVQKLGMWTKDAHAADSYGWLDNHMDESELTFVPSNKELTSGIYYIKGHEKPEPTVEEIIRQKTMQITNAVQELIDNNAQSRNYDNGFTCVSYIGSTDEIFHAEAVAFSAWRDHVWRKCYEILNAVTAGEIDYKIVDVDYVMERLPDLDW